MFLALQLFVTAQESGTPDTSVSEVLFIHANTTTFLTGETLYCKAYCLNAADYGRSRISKIAYIELIDNTRKSVFKQKLYLENGTAQGDFFIPTTLKTGNYKLIAYTKWMLNSRKSVFEMELAIINPFQAPDNNNGVNTVEIPEQTSMANGNPSFSIVTDKTTYALREKVSLGFKTTGQIPKGSYSLSIRKVDALPIKRQPTAREFMTANANAAPSPKTMTFLPELRGELLSGLIISKKGAKDLNHKTVALSVPGTSYAFKIAETDRSGRFTFILDKSPRLPHVTLQVMGDDRKDYGFALDDPNGIDLSTLKFEPGFGLNPEIKTSIEERSVANQIENAYYTRKRDSIAADLKSDPFFESLQKEYVLDDYTRFPTIKETITEVVTELYYTKKGNSYSIKLRNYETNNESFGDPLLMVDGLLIQDASELFDYNPDNIYKISLVNQPYVYGPRTFSGVINITTKNNDYQTRASGDFIRKIDIQRPANKKHYYHPTYGTNSNSRIPDYRYQLLWQPEFNGDISFYTSDVSGKFEIVLEGFTENGGPVSLRDFIDVK
jgi:hypothetical protein